MTTPSPRPNWLVAPRPGADPLQLSLWNPEPVLPRWPNGMPATIARALVPPGWWPILHDLWTELAEVTVYRCEEHGGFLMLEAEVKDGSLRDRLDPARLQWRVQTTCMGCGRPGLWCCVGLAATPVVACERCRERLEDGETVGGIADETYCWDGRHRVLLPKPGRQLRTSDDGRGAIQEQDRDFDTPMAPADLRALFQAIHTQMKRDVVGQDAAVASLGLLGALHVGGGLARGARALIVGPTGSGKSHVIVALLTAIESWGLPSVRVDAVDLTSPGWAGAPSIGMLLDAALAGEPAGSARARHAVIHLDEVHHIAYTPGEYGNMYAKRKEVFASLLALTGGGLVQLGERKVAWDSTQALVLASGAFTGVELGRGATVDALVRGGFPVEFASRITETVIGLARPDLPTTAAILRAWPAYRSLVAVGASLGLEVVLPDETIGRAARAAVEEVGGATIRTAAGWLVTALRAQLLARLIGGNSDPIGITPDELPIRYGGRGDSGDELGPGDGPADTFTPSGRSR